MAEFLRDGPASVAHLDADRLAVDLADATSTGDLRAEMRASGLLGEWARAHGEDGTELSMRALALARRLDDPSAVVVNRIRLATAAFYVGRHGEAEAELRSLIAQMEAEGRTERLDFAYQHLGKCLAEQDRFDEALRCFRAALALRSEPSLRASSRTAVDLSEEMIGRRTPGVTATAVEDCGGDGRDGR